MLTFQDSQHAFHKTNPYSCVSQRACAPAADSLQKIRRSFPKTCSEATVEMAASVSIVFTAFPRTSSSSQLVPCTAPVRRDTGSQKDPMHLKDGAPSTRELERGRGRTAAGISAILTAHRGTPLLPASAHAPHLPTFACHWLFPSFRPIKDTQMAA